MWLVANISWFFKEKGTGLRKTEWYSKVSILSLQNHSLKKNPTDILILSVRISVEGIEHLNLSVVCSKGDVREVENWV